MTDPSNPTVTQTPPYEDGGTAAFVYFDIAPAWGIFNGAVQVELASRTLVPGPGEQVEIKFITTGRVRCSPAAARHLRNALDACLKMLEEPQSQPIAANSRLN
jgi:hypothetical protein